MLPEKPWKSEAVLRLCLTLFVCQFLGSVLLAALRFSPAEKGTSVWLFGALVVGSLASSVTALVMLRQPWSLEQFMKRFLLLMLFIYLGLVFGAFIQKMLGKSGNQPSVFQVFVGTLFFQGVLLVLMPGFLRAHAMTWREGFGLNIKPLRAIACGVVVALIFLPLGEWLQYLSAKVLTALGHKAEAQVAVEALRNSTDFLNLAAMGLVAAVLAPVAEELLFRGLLYPAVKRVGYPRLALWGTSLLFALIHMNLATFVPLMLFALVLTLMYERTGNLLAPLTAHAVFNILNFIKFLMTEASSRAS